MILRSQVLRDQSNTVQAYSFLMSSLCKGTQLEISWGMKVNTSFVRQFLPSINFLGGLLMTAVWQTVSHWGHSPEAQVLFTAEWKNIHMLQVLKGKDDLTRVIYDPDLYPASLQVCWYHSLYLIPLVALTLGAVPGSECSLCVYRAAWNSLMKDDGTSRHCGWGANEEFYLHAILFLRISKLKY